MSIAHTPSTQLPLATSVIVCVAKATLHNVGYAIPPVNCLRQLKAYIIKANA